MPADFDRTQTTPEVIDLTGAPIEPPSDLPEYPTGDPAGSGDGSGPRHDGSHADAPDATGSEERETTTRERIIDAAAEVFLEKGFTGTRVVDIARKAGYTSGALYGYFDSRAELLAEAVARSSSEMLGRLLGTDTANGSAGAADPDSGDGPQDPLAVLALALDQIVEPLDESDQMLLDGVALAHREPVAGDRLAEALGQFRSQLTSSGDQELAPGAADLLVVLVLGITSARALGLHEPPPEELRRRLAGCLASPRM